MEYKGQHWLTNPHITKYQGMLCDNPHISIETVKPLNPAMLLPVYSRGPDHDYIKIMNEDFLAVWN
jgi:hypothetical protein